MAKQSYTSGQVLTAAQMGTLQTNDFNQTVSTKTTSYTLVAADVGTNVEMNAAGATSITVNTSLFAAGDTLILSNKGAGVCTVTAGTATVATAGVLTMNQNERGTLYFISASASIWYGSTGSGGDLTALTAGTGISITSPTGPVPTVAIDTTVTADLTTAQTLTTKTLTAPKINLSFNAQTGTTYTLVAGDSGKLVTSSNAAAITITIPPSIFAAGEQINVQSIGVGLSSFAAGSGVTVTSTGASSAAPILRARFSACTIICTASNVFTVIGDLS